MAKKSRKKHQTQPSASKPRTPRSKKKSNLLFAHGGPRFAKMNYILMGIGVLLLIIGYVMVSGGRQTANEFNYDEIYSTVRITIGPILILLGFVMEIIGIFYKPKEAESTEAEA